MKTSAITMLAAVLLLTAPAHAEKFDLSTVTCKKFFEYDKDNLALLLVWLEG
jgi:acid stress chaperone HdeB